MPSSSHNLDDILNKLKLHLYVGWDEETQTPVPIHDATYHYTDQRTLDVAVIKLPTESARKISSIYKPIGLRDILFDVDRRPGLFLVTGYPQGWMVVASNQIESAPLSFLGRFHDGSVSPWMEMKYDPSVHSLFEFNRQALGDGKQPVELPRFKDIQGISGCGVWRLLTLEENRRDWKPDMFKLVAIQHRYSEEYAYVHSTWINVAMRLLLLKYPQVKEAMGLLLPK